MIDEASEKPDDKKENDSDYSSGIESDNDLDLLVEQEVLEAVKMRKALKKELDKPQSDDDKSNSEVDDQTKMADIKNELTNVKESE